MPTHSTHDRLDDIVNGNGKKPKNRPIIAVLLLNTPQQMNAFCENELKESWGKFQNKLYVHFCLVDKYQYSRFGRDKGLKRIPAPNIWDEISNFINFHNEHPDTAAIFFFGKVPGEYIHLFNETKIKRLIRSEKKGHNQKRCRASKKLSSLIQRLRKLPATGQSKFV